MSRITTAVLSGAILMLVAAGSFGQGITIDLGKTETGRYMKLVGNTPGGDGEVQEDSVAGEWDARGLGGSMYFAVDDSFCYHLPAGQCVIVNVEYYDAPGVQIKLIYDAAGDQNKEEMESITTAGTNSWRSRSFTLRDAYFGNGQAHGADFHLTAVQGIMRINAVNVVPFSAYMDYGTVCDSANMARTEWMGLDSKDTIVVVEGEECVRTLATDNYLYINVADEFIRAGNHPYLFVSVEYYDEDPTYTMRLQYDAIEAVPGGTARRYKATAYVNGKGWNSFRTQTFEISDAYFDNRENGGSDFRLQIKTPGLTVNRITLAVLHTKPWPNIAIIPKFTAYKLLEPATIDGSLKEWSWWLHPYEVVARLNNDGSRNDEFYRTWLLNNQNVPVAEPGEIGVTDPGIPGNWDAADLGGGVSLMWDDQYVYVAANVKDNVLDVAGADWSEKDGVGLFLDVSHDYNAAGTAPIARKDDQSFVQGEHFFFFPATPHELGTWKHSTSQDGEAMSPAILKSVVTTDSGYIIEAAIPLDLVRDGLTWKPGVAQDRDNYDPLFGWMLNDADGIAPSSGRLMFGAHSEDDEFWSTLTMAPVPLVDNGIMIDLANSNYENWIHQVENSGDGAVQIIEVGGRKCAQLVNGYIYFNVSDTVIHAGDHTHLLVSVEYYDSTSGSTNFRLQYDAESAPYKDTYTVNLTGTNTWKSETFELTDAKFASSQNGGADFRLHSPTNDLIVNQVRIGIADLWIDLGDSARQTAYGINEANLGGDGVRTPAFIGGTWCERNGIGYPEGSRYFYFNVADSLVFNGNHRWLFLTAEYYDTTSSAGVGLNYDGMTSTFASSPDAAFILGTNQWKLHTFYIPDARFMNRWSGGGDFRLVGQGSGPTFINRVLIGFADRATGVDRNEDKPLAFRLEQNYPNPFNPVTTIRYSLPRRSHVTLAVFNTLGQVVAELAKGESDAGHHSVRFDASHVASGVYFYRLQTGSFVEVKKMMLVK